MTSLRKVMRGSVEQVSFMEKRVFNLIPPRGKGCGMCVCGGGRGVYSKLSLALGILHLKELENHCVRAMLN